MVAYSTLAGSRSEAPEMATRASSVLPAFCSSSARLKSCSARLWSSLETRGAFCALAPRHSMNRAILSNTFIGKPQFYPYQERFFLECFAQNRGHKRERQPSLPRDFQLLPRLERWILRVLLPAGSVRRSGGRRSQLRSRISGCADIAVD